MFLEQFVYEGLGHASYLVASQKTGDALVLDPQRHIEGYLGAARAKGVRIRYVVDTHGHNDYVSGALELAARTGARVCTGAEAQVAYDHRPLKDGDEIDLGPDVRVRVLHTPGHTPEHISLLVFDRTTSDEEPALFLSGGALLVGDLARPDLLGGREDAERAARVFCHTLQDKILTLPDHVQVFPTHVAGSLCGGSIGSRTSTTIGYERRTNAILAEVSSHPEFVESCIRLDDLPAVPPYWPRMRRMNTDGPPLIGAPREPRPMTPGDVERSRDEGAIVLDVRAPEAFGASHIPGAINVGSGDLFATWAGSVLPEGARVVLVMDDPADLWPITWDLLRIGYDEPEGWLAGGMRAWRITARPLAQVRQITVHDVRALLDADAVRLIDVRQPGEWTDAHVPGATFITGADVLRRIGDVPAGPVAVMCGSGYRSSVAASVIARETGATVLNVLGGFSAWKAAGYATEGADAPSPR